ncbi:MAG: HRDC domain-containing protein [bacterium]|nr:HRDC domain-containing protein [bacterium]
METCRWHSLLPVRIFTLSFDAERELFQEEDLNRFCATRSVTQKRAEFFAWKGKAWWTVWVEYDEAAQGEALPEWLDAEQTATYKRLKEWRFGVAEKQGLPAYVVATNRELEELARRRPQSLEAMRSIRGIGKSKLARYGKALLGLLREEGQAAAPPPVELPAQEPATEVSDGG